MNVKVSAPVRIIGVINILPALISINPSTMVRDVRPRADERHAPGPEETPSSRSGQDTGEADAEADERDGGTAQEDEDEHVEEGEFDQQPSDRPSP